MKISNAFNPSSQIIERSVDRCVSGWLLTRSLNYRDDAPPNGRCLSKRLCSLMLPPHVPENGNDVPIPSSFGDVEFWLC
jgi:hypothetical protein